MKTIVYVMGVPCSGKTTILNQWAKKGGKTVPEFSETVPDYVHNSGNESFSLKQKAQEWVLDQHRWKESLIQNTDSDGVVLVERSPLDIVAYGRAMDEYQGSHDSRMSPEESIARWTEQRVAGIDWTAGIFLLLEANIDLIGQRWIAQRNITLDQWRTYWKPFTERLQKAYHSILLGDGSTKKQQPIGIVRTDASIREAFVQVEEHFQDQSHTVKSFLMT